ncbi:hypothetical protein GGTG_03231 [Gaeumannomyces tritici R3-111a-1]|uniref:Uncharacterized protein n=1 Tax=Gaeumannomyces tritici (strain R3-111a-1) TaxID=644352 RepID=J3NPM4_GAET3|nr:hypothetical protein GGTG_03231 [Gaeumannomyces tritici R3-111a-1]EJT78129.1 hypothetical protein GGTG_03231 [Gaeumannomyces tritici R3-111a-1]
MDEAHPARAPNGFPHLINPMPRTKNTRSPGPPIRSAWRSRLRGRRRPGTGSFDGHARGRACMQNWSRVMPLATFVGVMKSHVAFLIRRTSLTVSLYNNDSLTNKCAGCRTKVKALADYCGDLRD